MVGVHVLEGTGDSDYTYYKNDDDSDDNGDQSSTSISFIPTSGGLPRANVMASGSSSVQPSFFLALTLLHFLQIGNNYDYNDDNEQLSFSPPIIFPFFTFLIIADIRSSLSLSPSW